MLCSSEYCVCMREGEREGETCIIIVHVFLERRIVMPVFLDLITSYLYGT